MSRALIETLLTTDSTLAGLGIDENSVFNQHDIDERPRNDGLFVVIRWGEPTNFVASIGRSPRVLTLWVHSPIDYGTDFDEIDKVIDRIDDIFAEIEDEPGTDDNSITAIRKQGRSGDLNDEGFLTVVRNAAYDVLYRRT